MPAKKIAPKYPKLSVEDLPWFQARMIWHMYQGAGISLSKAYILAGEIASTLADYPGFDLVKFLDFATKGRNF